MNPEFTFELPEGDNREIKVWWLEKTENGYYLCVSIEDKNNMETPNPDFDKAWLNSLSGKTKEDLCENFHCQPDKPLKDLPEKEDIKGANQAAHGLIGNILFPPKTINQTTHNRIKSQKTDNSPPHPFANIQEYRSETVRIEIPELENAIDALQAGLEHTQTALIEHDASSGRTTRRNKFWAQTLETDIAAMEKSIKFLKMKLVEQTTSYP